MLHSRTDDTFENIFAEIDRKLEEEGTVIPQRIHVRAGEIDAVINNLDPNKQYHLTLTDCSDRALENVFWLLQNHGVAHTITRLCILNSRELDRVPANISNLSHLSEFMMSQSAVLSLPDSFGDLRELQHLYLGYNQLTELPESFANLTGLETVYLNNNQLTRLPQAIGQLVNLKTLNLIHNSITCLPDSIGELRGIETLALYSNPLRYFPSSIKNLSKSVQDSIYSIKPTLLSKFFEAKPAVTMAASTAAITLGLMTFLEMALLPALALAAATTFVGLLALHYGGEYSPKVAAAGF